MIRVVIDTGIVISAAFRDRTPEEVILFVAGNPEFEWVVTSEILSEYFDVLGRKKFNLSDELQERWKNAIEDCTVTIASDTDVEFLRDPKDKAFIGCALAGEAQYLITGDDDFQDAKKIMETTVISVSQFKKLVIHNWLGLD